MIFSSRQFSISYAFYSHYYSKEELLYSLMNSLINKCNEDQGRVLDEIGYFDDSVAKIKLGRCIEPLYEDEELSKLFFRINGGEIFSQRLAKALADYQFSKSNKSSLTSKQRRNLRLYCDYRASGVVGVIRSSFLSEEPYAKEDLVELLYTIGTGGGSQMLDPVAQRHHPIHSTRFPQKSLILVHLCAILNQMKKKVTRG